MIGSMYKYKFWKGNLKFILIEVEVQRHFCGIILTDLMLRCEADGFLQLKLCGYRVLFEVATQIRTSTSVKALLFRYYVRISEQNIRDVSE